MTIFRFVLVASVAAASVSTPAMAQSVRASGAPVTSEATVGVRKAAFAPARIGKPAPPAPPRADTRQNRTLMIVGGAAMLTGAVVGKDPGTLISVGGAVVFLWGLYQFLQ